MKIGYARVSTTGQSLEAQRDALDAAGCEQVFQEKQSGKSADARDQLQAAIRFVRKDDALVVTRLDRLARSTFDLLDIDRKLKAKHVGLIVLGQNIDTTTAPGRMMFSMLGVIAEFERALITERAAEGRARAMASGVQFGRKPALDVKQLAALKREAKHWKESKSALADKHGISRATLYRLLGAEE